MLGIYCRLSVDKKGQKSIGNQREFGIKFAEKNQMEYKVYIDKGVSGGSAIKDRPAFNEMLDDIDLGLIDSIFVWNQDRLAREELTWFMLLDVMVKKEITLYESGNKIDLEDDGVRMMAGIKAIMHADERTNGSKKAKRAIKMNFEKGKAHGIMAYGYKADKKGYMVIDDNEAETVKKIYKLSLEGLGVNLISAELNRLGIPTRYQKLAVSGKKSKKTYRVKALSTGKVEVKKKKNTRWNPSTVMGILNNRNYIGQRIIQGITYECPALFREEYFEKVQKGLVRNGKTGGKRVSHKYLLQNLLHCNRCSHRITGRSVSKPPKLYLSYRCLDKRKQFAGRTKCDLRDCKCDPLDYVIWQRLFIDKVIMQSIHENFSYQKEDNKLDELQGQLDKMLSEQKKVKRERTNIVRQVAIGNFFDDEVKDSMKVYREREHELKFGIMDTKEKMDYILDNQNNVKNMEQEIDSIKRDAPLEKKQKIVEKYIEKISLDYDEGAYYIRVDFKVDIPFELYVMDTKYNLALDGRSNTCIPISEKYKKHYATIGEEPVPVLPLVSRLMMKTDNYNYGEKTALFLPPEMIEHFRASKRDS